MGAAAHVGIPQRTGDSGPGARVALFVVMHHQPCNDAENPMKPNQANTPGDVTRRHAEKAAR
jgi:hypothetical protein